MSLSRFLPRLVSRTSLVGRLNTSALPKPQVKFRESSVLLLSQSHQFERASGLVSCSRSFSTTFPCLGRQKNVTSAADDVANLPRKLRGSSLAKLLRDQEVSEGIKESIIGLFDSIPEACLEGVFDPSAPSPSNIPVKHLDAYLSELVYCKKKLNNYIGATEEDLNLDHQALKSCSARATNERIKKLNERVASHRARISLLKSALVEVETEILKVDLPRTTPSIEPRIVEFDPVSFSNTISEYFDGKKREYEDLLIKVPEAVEDFRVIWKESCAIPNNLADDVFEAEVDDQFLDEVLGHVATRQNQFLTKAHGPSKYYNALIALHSPPGGGKSFLLYSIAKFALNPSKLKQFLGRNPRMFKLPPLPSKTPQRQGSITINEDPIQIPRCFQYPIGLTITHIESQATLDEEYSGESIDEFTGWRILHSYFANFNSLNLQDFISIFRPLIVSKLTATKAIDVVLHHAKEAYKKAHPGQQVSNPHIFLCADEIMKSVDTDMLITVLGGILDRFLNVSVFISTLDVYHVITEPEYRQAQTLSEKQPRIQLRNSSNSGRRIFWATVNPVPMPQVIKLFEKIGFDPRQSSCLNAALSMANGHPRTLQAIRDLAVDKKIPTVGAPLDFIKDIVIAANALTPPLVRLGLNGEEQDATLPYDPQDPKGMRYGDLLTTGTFLNSINPDKTAKFVPKLSLIRIYSHFLKNLDLKESTLRLRKDLRRKPSSKADPTKELLRWTSLYEILQVPFPTPSETFVSHSEYLETFHGYWEDTRRVAIVGDKKETPFLVEEFYGISHDLTQGTSANSDYLESEGALLFGEDVSVLMKPNFVGPIKTMITLNEKEFASYLANGFGKAASDHNSRLSSASPSLRPASEGTPSHDVEEKKKPQLNGSIFDVIIKPEERTNEGYDLVLFEKTVLDPADPNQLGDPVAIFIECKSTMTQAIDKKNPGLRSGECTQPSYLTADMILSKVESCVKQFKSRILEHDEGKGRKSGAPGFTKLSQLFVVFVSTQRVSQKSFETASEVLREKYGNVNPDQRPNVVVIPRKRLLDLYTPTLSYTPAFLDHQEIEQDYHEL